MVTPLTPLTLRPVLIETGSVDEDGRLVFAGGRLVAVLVRLSASAHPGTGLQDKWFLEAGFGPCAMQLRDVFPVLDDAEAWVHRALARGAPPHGVCPGRVPGA